MISQSKFSVLICPKSKSEDYIEDFIMESNDSCVESSEGSILCNNSKNVSNNSQGNNHCKRGTQEVLAKKVWKEINQLGISGGENDGICIEQSGEWRKWT